MAKFEDREKRRKGSIVGRIVARAPASGGRGRPKEDRETKKRISLSVLPGLYEDVQRIAYVQRRSVSGLVGELMEQFRTEHAEELREYGKLKSAGKRKRNG